MHLVPSAVLLICKKWIECICMLKDIRQNCLKSEDKQYLVLLCTQQHMWWSFLHSGNVVTETGYQCGAVRSAMSTSATPFSSNAAAMTDKRWYDVSRSTDFWCTPLLPSSPKTFVVWSITNCVMAFLSPLQASAISFACSTRAGKERSSLAVKQNDHGFHIKRLLAKVVWDDA